MINPSNQSITSLMDWLYRDEEFAEVFSLSTTVDLWVQVEVALAAAQNDVGLIKPGASELIRQTAATLTIDMHRLRRETLVVGYPILPLLHQFDEALPDGAKGCLHFGATTQDVMDTALSLQLVRASSLLGSRLMQLGDALATLVRQHGETTMAARTHAQHAVPTTFGAKCATFLSELSRHWDRLDAAQARVGLVSLYGAGGTNAAMGPDAREVRTIMADRLELGVSDVPWHVTRDSLAEFVLLTAMISASCTRLAREVVDLSRTEVAEVSERGGHLRGASSTMPQKANPVTSEACIGYGAFVASLVGAALRAMEAGHERAAGEWQVEWKVIPEAIIATGSALTLAADLVTNLAVDPDRMTSNLDLDGGLLIAEAYMMGLAPIIGRERAHDLVYDAAKACRTSGAPIEEPLSVAVPGIADYFSEWPLTPRSYLGDVRHVCDVALREWAGRRRAGVDGSLSPHGNVEAARTSPSIPAVP